MRTLLAFFIVLAMCGALFFLAPHHRRTADPFRKRTLAGMYWDLLGDVPELLANGKLAFLLLAVAGAAVCFYPAAMVLMVRFFTAGPQRSGGGIFLLTGLVGLAGAAANFIAMIALDMNISFGVGSSTKDQTVFIVLIPMFQIAFALASIAIGVSSFCANWAHRMVVAL
jgi:hypothetical protein